MKEKIELNGEAISLRKEFGEDLDSPIDIFSLIHNNEDLTMVFYPMSNRVSGMCIRCICQPKIRSKNHSILGHFLVNKCASENCTKAQTF